MTRRQRRFANRLSSRCVQKDFRIRAIDWPRPGRGLVKKRRRFSPCVVYKHARRDAGSISLNTPLYQWLASFLWQKWPTFIDLWSTAKVFLVAAIDSNKKKKDCQLKNWNNILFYSFTRFNALNCKLLLYYFTYEGDNLKKKRFTRRFCYFFAKNNSRKDERVSRSTRWPPLHCSFLMTDLYFSPSYSVVHV